MASRSIGERLAQDVDALGLESSRWFMGIVDTSSDCMMMLREHLHILDPDEDFIPLPQTKSSITFLGHFHVHDCARLGGQFDFHQWPGSRDVFDCGSELR